MWRLQDIFQESVLSFHHVEEMHSPETNSGCQAWGQKPLFLSFPYVLNPSRVILVAIRTISSRCQ